MRLAHQLPLLSAEAFRAADTNRDGVLSGYEFNQAGFARFEALDQNGDGFITSMRKKDIDGTWYPSSIDSRVMLRVRSRNGGRWNYVPTEWNGQFFKEEDPDPVEDELAPRDQWYRLYTEGENVSESNPELEGRESANFNRNWSAEWRAEQWGAGPYPFSLPEVNAVAQFISSHKNIFFCYDFHSNGSSRNILVRPPWITHTTLCRQRTTTSISV